MRKLVIPAQPVNFGADACLQAVFAHDVAVHRRGIERSAQFFLRPIVPDRAEEGTGHVVAVARDSPPRRGQKYELHAGGTWGNRGQKP